MLQTSYEGLTVERRDEGVVLITIVGHGPMNSVDNEIHDAMNAIWRDIDADPSVLVAVITGAGQVFSAGGNLEQWGDALGNSEEAMRTFTLATGLIENLINCGKPIISAINGPAVGVALAIALLADISIVGESAKLGDGHVRIGLPAGDHAVIIWPLLCGLAQSKYYLLTGELIGGPEAARIGLVTKCVSDDAVLSEALTIASRLARGPKWALYGTKRSLNHWLRQAGPSFEYSATVEVLGMFGNEAREGLNSFLEKRRPHFE